MVEAKNVSLVKLSDLYLYFSKGDSPYTHVMNDARACEVDENNLIPLWQAGNLPLEYAWGLNGLGAFALASLHYWRKCIDFDYFDVGASIGITTISQGVFYKRCSQTNRIYAFEPGETYGLLQRSVEVNRLSDTTLCINAAATDETGKVIFHQPTNNSPSCSLLREAMMRPGITDTQSVIVDGIKIDDFIKTTRSAPGLLIKIDTEGADFKVLDGMRQTMTDRVCTIQIEYFPDPMECYTNPIQRLLELADEYHLLDSGDDVKTILDPTEASIRSFTEKTKQRPLPATDILLIAKRLPGSMDLRDRIIGG